jgi:hypothetical protein
MKPASSSISLRSLRNRPPPTSIPKGLPQPQIKYDIADWMNFSPILLLPSEVIKNFKQKYCVNMNYLFITFSNSGSYSIVDLFAIKRQENYPTSL